MVKDIIEKLKNGELKPNIYSSTNENNENVIIMCLTDKHIVTYTLQKNNWIRINEYDESGNMIGETYEK